MGTPSRQHHRVIRRFGLPVINKQYKWQHIQANRKRSGVRLRNYSLTDEQRAQVGEVRFSADSISIVTPQVGEIAFHVTDRVRPSKVVFGTKSSPVPLTMEVDIKPLSEASSEVQTVINVEIPAMLRPLIGPQLQKAADKFGELMAGLSR